jgi:hypothetical protein
MKKQKEREREARDLRQFQLGMRHAYELMLDEMKEQASFHYLNGSEIVSSVYRQGVRRCEKLIETCDQRLNHGC